MSNDLEHRIAALAESWDRNAAPVNIDEIMSTDHSAAFDLSAEDESADESRTDVVIVDIERSRRGPHRVLAISAAVAAAIVAVLVIVAQREPEPLDPASPAATDTSAAPAAGTDTAPAAVVPTAPATTPESPDTTSVEEPAPADFAATLAEIDAARNEALRAFTTIGFTVHHTASYPEGAVLAGSYVQPDSTAQVVFRNDGSAAVTSETAGTSYYDAVTGTARLAYTDANGQPAYQQLDGQADSSVAVGVPTGLPNGIVTPIGNVSQDVVAITEEDLDGRPTWRIHQRFDRPAPDPAGEATTWIDQATGITIKTNTVGMSMIDEGQGRIPLTEVITLSDLQPGVAMPDNFPSPFPPDAAVAISGDPTAFGPIALEDAIAELGAGIVVPTLPADQTSIQRMNFGTTDGGTSVSPSLIMRWFDGFVRTELRVMRYPSTMVMEDTCTRCDQSLLEELQSQPADQVDIRAVRNGVNVSINGDATTVRDIIGSLMSSPAAAVPVNDPAEALVADEPPYGRGAIVGDEYDYLLHVHCGVQWARIDGSWFETEPLNDGHGNPPTGWGNPWDSGSLTMTDSDTASYRSDNGETITFVRTDGDGPPPCD